MASPPNREVLSSRPPPAARSPPPQRLNNMYVEHCNQPLEKVEAVMDRDTYLTADEAVAFGIVDAVLKRPPAASESE